jgi:hypothetical protein
MHTAPSAATAGAAIAAAVNASNINAASRTIESSRQKQTPDSDPVRRQCDRRSGRPQ